MSLQPLPVCSEHVQTPQREPGLDQKQERDQDPKSIKEYKVDPQVQRAGCVQVRTAQQPIRTKGHPASVQLAHTQCDLQEVPVQTQVMSSIQADQYLISLSCL